LNWILLLGSDSPEFYPWQPILQGETPTRFKKLTCKGRDPKLSKIAQPLGVGRNAYRIDTLQQARSSLRHDTVTHAEWYVGVVDTYCKTVMIASQLRPKLNEIPPDKIADLLALKKKWGLPDPRLTSNARAIELTPISPADDASNTAPSRQPASYDVDGLVSRLTAEVSGFLRGTE
jgi:hypothetical protein